MLCLKNLLWCRGLYVQNLIKLLILGWPTDHISVNGHLVQAWPAKGHNEAKLDVILTTAQLLQLAVRDESVHVFS